MLIAGACSVRTWRLIKLPCVFGHIPFTRRRRMFAMTMCSASTTTSNLSKKKNKEKVIVISGPTGAGKSRLALELAKRLNGEIISADSVQVYQGLDVGSAKPSACDRKEVPHHLVDILHPSEDYSVGKFFEDARQATRDILNSGRVPIVTGGTGLYLRWFIYGKPDVPKASQDISSKVYSELMILQRRGDWDAAVQLLVKAGDPKAQSLASNDWYRLRRSLEIIKSSGLPPSAFPVPYDSFRELSVSSVSDCSHGNDINSSADELEEGERDLEYEFICFFLSSQRLDLYRSIDFRCEDMLSGKEIYYWYPMYSMYLLFEIKGCKIARNCTSITHFMFADDLVMFGPALVKEAEALKSCLDLYCKWSGQVVNRAKSGIHFLKGTDSQKAMDIRSVMNMGGIAKEAVYLGMPLFPARSKNLSFNYILERMTNRIHGWKSKLLSYAGRATMIIAVAAALPAYVMAVNDLPSNLCGKMDQAMRGFWWGHKNKRGLCLKKWEKVCLPKSLGGMGFRQMKENNQALLSKLAWQMAANEDRFWVEQVRSKYCSRQAFMHFEKRQSDSMMWKGILNCRSLIEKGACFVIGDGASVNVWTDPWVPSIKGFKVNLFLERDDIPMLVEDLIDKDRREWKLDELKYLFYDQTIEAILEIDIPMEITEDKLCWIPSRDGDFSVKSAYRLGLSLKLEDVIVSGMVSSGISRLWKANMQEQLKVFLWRCLKGCIPTRSNLSRRMPIDDKECLMCGHEEETSIHIFFEWPFTKAAWFATWNLRTELFNFSSCGEWFEAILKDKLILCLKEADVDACAVATTMEEIWKWRNA